MSEIGHNSGASAVAGAQLKSLVERIERLEEEKREVADQVKEVYAEAKGNGFDAKIIRKVIARRKKPNAELEEEEAMLDLYESALMSGASSDVLDALNPEGE